MVFGLPIGINSGRFAMQSLKNYLQSFLLFILFSVLGIASGFVVAKLLTAPINQGAFIFWKSLNSPYKFTEIVDANSQTVWAQTNDGKIYYRHARCSLPSDCDGWIETSVIDNNFGDNPWERPMERMTSCQTEGEKYPKEPSGKVVECAAVQVYGAEFGLRIYYALLADGSIIFWKQSGSMISDILLNLCVITIGLGLGIAAFFVISTRWKILPSNTSHYGKFHDN
jgi:hypothetical protein